MNKKLFLIPILLLFLLSFVSASYTNYYEPSFKSSVLSVAGVDSGLSYYEERCIDVSSYLGDGYSSDGVDSDGCPVVSKEIVVNTIVSGSLGTRSFRSGTVDYCTRCTNNYPSRYSGAEQRVAADRACSDKFGVDWKYAGCTRRGGDCALCGAFYTDVKGGLEKVLNTCVFDSGDMLVAETFASSFDKFDLRYPLKSVCRATPAIVTDSALLKSFSSTNILDDLVNGDSVVVGSSETVTVFYVIENVFDLPTDCSASSNLAYNPEDDVCASTLGFTYICSEGVFDALTGVCVVSPSSASICDKGRYDVSLDVCVYNPPLQVDCGSDSCFYSVEKDACVCEIEEDFLCPSSYFLFEPSKEECSVLGGVYFLCPQCPVDKICPESVCEPLCSIGIGCRQSSNPLFDACNNDVLSDLSSKGVCTVFADDNKSVVLNSFNVCGEQGSYNILGFCELPYVSNFVCPQGSLAVKGDCISVPESFIDCPDNTVYDMDNDRCVSSILLYDPVVDVVVDYREFSISCESDVDCGSGFVCDSQKVCHTELSEAKKPLLTYFLIGVFVVVSVIFIFKNKSKKSKKSRGRSR